MLLTHRKLLQSKAIAIENDLRGTLRVPRLWNRKNSTRTAALWVDRAPLGRAPLVGENGASSRFGGRAEVVEGAKAGYGLNGGGSERQTSLRGSSPSLR
jgi:hypothetical protein